MHPEPALTYDVDGITFTLNKTSYSCTWVAPHTCTLLVLHKHGSQESWQVKGGPGGSSVTGYWAKTREGALQTHLDAVAREVAIRAEWLADVSELRNVAE